MKKIATLLVLAVMAAAAGCIQLQTETVIDNKGGGTLTMNYTMSAEVEQAFQELKTIDSGMDEDMGDVPLFDDSFDKAGLEAKLKESGARLKSFENGIENGNRHAKLVVEFSDIDGMQAALGGAMGDSGSLAVFRTDDGNYVLRGVPGSGADDEEEEEAPDMSNPEDMSKAMENAQKSMAIMGKLMAHMNEMVMEMRITFPSDVISHNAHSLEGRTCIWRIDSSNMMSAQGMDEPEVVFSGQGVSIDAAQY